VKPIRRFTFSGVLVAVQGGGSLVELPREVADALGPPARQRVRGTLNGVAYRSNIGPMGGGRTYLGIHKAVRSEAGVSFGDLVHIVIEADEVARVVVVPDALATALAAEPAARSAFDRLSFTDRKEMAASIAEAARAATRERRLAAAMARLRSQ
jgi:hypothetical protein